MYGTQQGAGSAGIHTVIPGDTLYKISERYDIAMRDIALANRLQAPFKVSPGMRLKMPPPQKYKARPGDTLYSISRLFGVNTSEIAEMNNLRAPYKVEPGQTLRLPTVTRKTAPPPRAVIASVPKVEKPVQIAPLPGQKPVAAPEKAEEVAAVSVPSAKPEPKAKITAQTPKRASNKFLRPVEGSIISSYGPKENGLHNDGINISAPAGAPVRAADNGVVVYAGNELKGSGNLVLVRHEGRWMTAYAHMGNIQIKRGDVIKRGQTIGTVGSTGSVDSPQLHFEVRRGTEAINPKQYLEG